MPSSQFFYIPQVMTLILNSPHKSILDVGPGFGKYGVLCREYCDLIPTWFAKGLNGFDKENWQIRIDCIEPFEKYITPLHKYIYDNIYIGKAEDLVSTLDTYDLILLIGVIEHIEKEAGVALLKECQKKAKSIIVVTPNGFKPQKAEWNNPFEEHKCGWTAKEFNELNFDCAVLRETNKIIAHWLKNGYRYFI